MNSIFNILRSILDIVEGLDPDAIPHFMIPSKKILVLAALVVAVLVLSGCGRSVFTGKREARGVWMSRFEYTGEKTRNNPGAGRDVIRSVFEKARRAKFNMVFFQVRGNADALYRSEREPWSALLTGTLGQDPGWDPLETAVEEAHRLGLELHVWINTFPIWRGAAPPPESTPRQIFLDRPEWVVCDSAGIPMKVEGNDYVWGSPGNPEFRNHILGVISDIVGRYDVEGVHFDYIRYPEGTTARGYSRDSASIAGFVSPESNPHKLSWEHWQREQVNRFVFDAYNMVTAMKPWVKMSAAVIGKYTGAGWTAYDAAFQDPRRWMELGKIDFIVPMVYWERSHRTHPFVPLITQWRDRVAYERHVVPGISAGLQERIGWSEISAEIAAVRDRGLPGVVLFSSAGLDKAWEVLGVDEFPYWSLPPVMLWKDSVPPPMPLNLSAERVPTGIALRWEAPTKEEPLSYIIYRSENPVLMRNDVHGIAGVTGRNDTEFLDRQPSDGDVFYRVSALDRMFNEGKETQPVRVSGRGVLSSTNAAQSQ